MFCQQCGEIVEEGQTFCYDCSQKMFAPQQAPSYAPGDAFGRPQQGQPQQNQQATGSEHVSQYLDQHSVAPTTQYRPYQQQVADARQDKTSLVQGLGIAAMVSGAIVMASTFLVWVTSSGFDFIVAINPTGWQFMTKAGGVGGNFMFIRAEGILYFTGLWSILAGLGIITGAVLLLAGYRQGGRASGIAGVVGVGAATVNIVMTFKLQNGIGYGVWLFLLFSIVAVVCSEIATRNA